MVELESKFLYWWSDMRASATEATIVMLCRAAFHAGWHAAQQGVQPTGGTLPAPQYGIQNEYDPAFKSSRVPPTSG